MRPLSLLFNVGIVIFSKMFYLLLTTPPRPWTATPAAR
jgi:hypothetical protein